MSLSIAHSLGLKKLQFEQVLQRRRFISNDIRKFIQPSAEARMVAFRKKIQAGAAAEPGYDSVLDRQDAIELKRLKSVMNAVAMRQQATLAAATAMQQRFALGEVSESDIIHPAQLCTDFTSPVTDVSVPPGAIVRATPCRPGAPSSEFPH